MMLSLLAILGAPVAAERVPAEGAVCLLSLRARRHREADYRLADMFFGHGRDDANGAAYHVAQFPDSVAAAYLQRTRMDAEWSVLRDIVESRHANKPAAGALVVHLDTGVVSAANEPVERFLDEPTPQCFEPALFEPAGFVSAQPLDYFRLPLPAGIHEVVLVPTGGLGDPKSHQYTRAVAALLRARGLRVSTRPADGADEALLYMAQASHFLPGGGSLSAVCAGLVWYAGGEVLGEPVTRLRAGQVVSRCWAHSSGYVLRRFLLPWAVVFAAVFAGLPKVARPAEEKIDARRAKYGTFPGDAVRRLPQEEIREVESQPEHEPEAPTPDKPRASGEPEETAPEVFALGESGSEAGEPRRASTIEQEYESQVFALDAGGETGSEAGEPRRASTIEQEYECLAQR